MALAADPPSMSELNAAAADRVRVADLDGEPHADAFPGREPKTIRLSLEAGERVPEHEHPDRTVLFHALEGAIDVALGGDTHRVEAGEILRFGGESTVRPTAVEDAVALVVLAPRPAE
jgi:quercetin dioxygenase-like cupin family protein